MVFLIMQIEEKYGFVDQLLAQDKQGHQRLTDGLGPDLIYHPHHRPAGMTEDGHERHRLCASAIIKKGGRIDLMDLARRWVQDIDVSKFGYLLGPQDQVIYYSLLKLEFRRGKSERMPCGLHLSELPK